MTIRKKEFTIFVNVTAGVRSTGAKYQLLPIIFVVLVVLSIVGMAQTNVPAKSVEFVQGPLPIWLKSGTVRFARFDGGPLEAQKSVRSSWGARFSPQDRDVTTNLYGTYGDRMVNLLDQAKINFVWVTYSAGFSWQ